MPVVSDSYMGVFSPADIQQRIMEFMAAKRDFPFIQADELVGCFYLFGKDHGVAESEVEQASSLARTAVERIATDIRLYRSRPGKLDSGFTRQNYTKRSLQIVVDNAGDFSEVDRRVSGDPAILADCFAQHVSYHKQEFFFELFGPIKSGDLAGAGRQSLDRRMVLLGYNVRDRSAISSGSPLEPFVRWLARSRP